MVFTSLLSGFSMNVLEIMSAEHSLFFFVKIKQSFATRIDPDLRPLPYIPIISGLFVLFDQPYAITLKISSADIPHLSKIVRLSVG